MKKIILLLSLLLIVSFVASAQTTKTPEKTSTYSIFNVEKIDDVVIFDATLTTESRTSTATIVASCTTRIAQMVSLIIEGQVYRPTYKPSAPAKDSPADRAIIEACKSKESLLKIN